MAQGAETTVAQCSPTVEWADYAAVQVVWEPIWKRAHAQLVFG